MGMICNITCNYFNLNEVLSSLMVSDVFECASVSQDFFAFHCMFSDVLEFLLEVLECS